MSDKPLHVQTAEALGWTDCHEINGVWIGHDGTETKEIPGYGETWEATGPFVDRFQINLNEEDGQWEAYCYWPDAPEGFTRAPFATARTPCEAIAHMVIMTKDYQKGKQGI